MGMTATRCPLCSGRLDYSGTQLACTGCRTAYSSNAFVTQPLPVDWRPSPTVATLVEPRRRYPRDTASMAVTVRIAVVG